MSLWRQLSRGIRALVDRGAADRDAADEVQHFLDEATAAFSQEGMTPEQARLAARRQLGSATAVREGIQTVGWEHAVGSFVADLRYGARRLRATPGFTIVTVLTLAIGIGGATAIFSAVNPVLFASLPYPHPDRLVSIDEIHRNGSRGDGTYALYREYLQRAHAFDAIAVSRPWRPTITGSDRPERLEGQRVSSQYFRVLGVAPVIGRDFQPADDRRDAPRVVLLSDGFWRRRFNADPAVVGSEIRLDDERFTVIGVLPAAFENVAAPAAGVWTPLQFDNALPVNGREWGHNLKTIARLGSRVTLADATSDVSTIGRALIDRLHPNTYDPNTQFAAIPLRDELASGVRPALVAILAAVILVLVIACVNVTNLVLARGVHRRSEFALRTALGAGRIRIIRQVLTESLLLAAAGGTAGVCAAVFGVRALVALSPPDLPRAGAIAVDKPVLLFAVAATIAVGLLCGAIPAVQAVRRNPHDEIQQGSTRTVAGSRRTRRLLAIVEVALALVLMVSSGLLYRSLQRLFAVPSGFDAHGLLTLQVQVVGHRYDADGATERLYAAQLDAVRRVPGVEAAGFTSQLPLSGEKDQYGARFPARGPLPEDTFGGVYRYAASPGYLEAAGIPLLVGRGLSDHDDAAAPPVVLISASLAKARFGTANPVGADVRIGPDKPFTIIGVVGDVRQVSLAGDLPQAVYLNAAQSWFADSPRTFVVRARGDVVALAPAIRSAIWSVDKDQPITRVESMEDIIASSAAERRFALILFETFGLTALVLAAIGIYGVLAGSVSERTREIGLRMALGATRREIVSLVMRQAMALTCAGMMIGLITVLFTSRGLETLLFGVTKRDPVTYAAVIVVLLGAAALASWLPAWRAARVDPSVTLRAD
jgi:putative ABC transport system permease protein